MENVEKLIGKKVREARLKLGMTQKELAKNAKSSVTTINRLEKGKQFPHSDTIKEVARVLNLSYADMLLENHNLKNTELEDRITKAIKEGFEAANKPTVSIQDTKNMSEKDKLILSIQDQLKNLNMKQLDDLKDVIEELKSGDDILDMKSDKNKAK